MAKGGLIGALRVTLGMDTAAFDTGLKKSRGGLSGFAKNAKVAAAAGAAAFVAAGAAVGAAVKGMIDHADKMAKLAQSVGVPVAELSALAHAAELSGVGLDGLAKGLKKLSQNMFDAAQGLGEGKRAFADLGIDVRRSDGTLKTSTEVMGEVADKFAGMKDGAAKTAIAMRLFGKAGADMIPMLNGGKASLAAMIKEAHELGIVLDKETGKKAEAFNDNLTRLGAVKRGITLQLTTALLPALESFSETILGAAKNTKGMKAVGEALGFTFRVLITIVLGAIASFTSLALTVATVAKAFMAVVRGDFAGAWTEIKKGFGDIHDAAQATMGQIPKLWSKAAAETKAQAKKTGKDFAAPAEEAAKLTDKAAKEIADSVREAEAIIAGLASKGEQASASYTQRLAILRREYDAGRLAADAFADAVTRLNIEMEADRGGFEPVSGSTPPGFKPAAEVIAPLAEVQASIDEASAYARERFSWAFSDGVMAAFGGRWQDFAVSVLQDVVRRGLEDAGAQLYDIFESFGGVQRLGSAVAGVFKLPGFAQGGEFTVGGQPGVDKNLVAFLASAGERVQVSTPAQQRNDDVSAITEARQKFEAGGSWAANAVANANIGGTIDRASRVFGGAVERAVSVWPAANLFGFNDGGRFMVDGMAGIDRNIVAFRASMGERVTVETRAQQRASADGRGGGVTIIQNFPQGDPDSFRRSARQVANSIKRVI